MGRAGMLGARVCFVRLPSLGCEVGPRLGVELHHGHRCNGGSASWLVYWERFCFFVSLLSSLRGPPDRRLTR